MRRNQPAPKMLGALNVSEAVRTMDVLLGTWVDYREIKFGVNSVTLSAAVPGSPNTMPVYHSMRIPKEQPPVVAKPHSYFKDPVELAFDLESAMDHKENDIPLRVIWNDPVARTFWLACKTCFLSSQYFRRAMIDNAKTARDRPPRTVEDLIVVLGSGFYEHVSLEFRARLWPYIVYELQCEGRWPYFGIPPNMQVKRGLGWVSAQERT